MAHLGQWVIPPRTNYTKLSDITGITFEDGKQYTFQVQNPAIVISSQTVPTEGGYFINNIDLNLYTKRTGEDFYIKTPYSHAIINISE